MRREESKREEGNERKLLTEREREVRRSGDERRRGKEERKTRIYDEATCSIYPGICAVSSEFGFFPKKTETAS